MMKVEGSKLFRLYFHELFWLASGIRENCEAIFEETLPSKGKRYIKVSPELHTRIVTVLINAANIAKMIRIPKEKSSKKLSTAYKFRQKRVEALRLVLS